VLTDLDRLRGMLSERIPEGGDETDTLFTSEQIQDYLDRAGGGLEKAAYFGWRDKAAEYTNLANVSEGNSARNFSDLADNAQAMVDVYAKASGILSTPGRVRSRKIVRTGGSIE
jgi:hypothetical protein